jgi:phage baseplate assembly protein W
MPFSLGRDGVVVHTEVPDLQTQQHIEALVTTQPGSRVMLPTYGIPTMPMVFEPGNEVVTGKLIIDVKAGMATWEPNVIVQDIRPIPSEIDDYGTSSVEIDWVQGAVAAFSQVQTATLLVGGTVVAETPGV